ncbi:MAG: SsrA-binding protein SmpB [bacterium]|nr:SsrA-binding protein SmpB [bacterium]
MRIFNRHVRRDYQIIEKFEAGVELSGWEVKSIREGKINLDEAFVRIKDGQAWLFNAYIHPYRFAALENTDPKRTRKLLLHKKEILSLEIKMKQKRLTIVPIVCYNRRGLIKLEVGLAKGKREFEHREEIKIKDLTREAEQELSN